VTLVPADWAEITKLIFSKEYDIATWGILGSDEIEQYTMAAFHFESPGISPDMQMVKLTASLSLYARAWSQRSCIDSAMPSFLQPLITVESIPWLN
jgi:hypothetical protein